MDALATATMQNTKPYVPPITVGRVIKVYDGDTITVATVIHGQVFRVNVRLCGIDTPEIRGTPGPERQLAATARDELSRLIMGRTVLLSNVRNDKYGGRYVATVCVETSPCNIVDCSTYMITKGLARPYDGKTKKPWDMLN